LEHVEFFKLVNGSTINPNYVHFTPGPAQDVQRGDTFFLGSFSYRNGAWFGLSTETRFHITLTTVSTDSSLNGHVLSDDVVLYITPTVTGNAPEQNADFLYFSDFTNLGSVRAYEAFDSPTGTNVVNVGLHGRIGSLIATEWGLASGGFVDPESQQNRRLRRRCPSRRRSSFSEAV